MLEVLPSCHVCASVVTGFWLLPILCTDSKCCGAGAKSYQQAEAAGGALGWRLTADQVAALDAASDKTPQSQGLPFENW